MSPLSFLQSGGEMGSVVGAMDWSRTPLGPIESWPQSLRTSISLCLASNFPIALAWGSQRIQIYNDGYWPICGAKHPHSMGQDFKECWFSAWPVIGAAFEQATAGRAAFLENERMFLDRNGYLEETFFTFSFSPIRDDTGQVAGLFHPVTELTQASLATRRLKVLQDLADHTANARTVAEACGLIIDALDGQELDLPFVLLYLVDRAGGQARLVSATGLDPASTACPPLVDLVADTGHWPLAHAVRSGQPVEVVELERFGLESCRPYPEPPNTAFVLPLRAAGWDHPAGLLVAGVSARRPVDDPYRAFYALLRESVTTALSNARAYEEESARAEALAEIDRTKTMFFSNVSHEFRTPLTLMLGPTEEALASPEQALTGENLAAVYRNELRLLKLVNTLLDFSRIEAGRAQATYEPTDLAELTGDFASAFRSAIDRAGLRFDVDCPPLSQPVYVDREMWEKIVLNLVSNALKFTFEGTIRVALLERDGRVELEVRDTGVGIPPAELPRLFERFHRVQNARARTHEGSGIGLALVNELVKLHGGTLLVSSAVDAGTTFTVAIPFGTTHLASDRIGATRTAASPATGATPYVEEALRWLPTEDSVSTSPAPPLPAAPASEKPARIVLADDNADMRDYVRRILGDRWTIDAFNDGLSALAAIRANPPAVVIADVMMPGLDGFELLRELRATPATKNIPVIVLSARAGEEARIDGLQAGADDYLVKPFSARELRARVDAQILRAEIRHVEEAHDRRLVSVFTHAPVAIAILRGPAHVFEFVNEPYLDLIGRRPVLGKTIRQALPEIGAQGIYELLDSVYTSGQPFIAESLRATLNRGAEGAPEERYFKLVYQPMLDGEGRTEGIAVVAVDVTELAGARRAAESASRAKDEFIAMLSHELRNPLAPILTALQLMRLRGIDAAERERTIIERQAKHLVGLVDDLLDVSRITRGKVELDKAPVELANVIAKAIETTSPLLEERQHTLDVHVARRGLSVDADADRLAQVVANLLTNAAKYTEPAGHVRVAAERDSEFVVLTVRDSGIGIEADMLPKVFDLFTQAEQTSDRSRGGLGLGLAIVRNLVALHGGIVSASSEGRGRGTTFTVRLPFAPMPDPDGGDEGVGLTVQPRTAEGCRVLIVDDNEDSAEMLADALSALGHDTRIALDGPGALSVVTSFQPDVALLDIGLPVMDGHELARRLKAEPDTRQIRLIAVTGYGQLRDRSASTEAGFDAHLVKPVDLDELAQLLTSLTNLDTKARQ
ncbi:MAG: response regulator [Acidobacteria bacterium]|nr:response regulator [Acidobacteriota bacterium]